MTSIEKIFEGKYPAKEHARRVAESIASNGGHKEGIIYLEAQKSKYNEV
jgi:Xaa-Pro dipeptidase